MGDQLLRSFTTKHYYISLSSFLYQVNRDFSRYKTLIIALKSYYLSLQLFSCQRSRYREVGGDLMEPSIITRSCQGFLVRKKVTFSEPMSQIFLVSVAKLFYRKKPC
ncbi:hypothetical protein N44_01300 [Microcystis aeruginosa NIES-44]|uniref:Uncharacterized protein n=1 Tax=Microcystis aeruginosa NIES-44 TaxID=449439 RepID=A0A0A1VSC8_MICAE|nr:hypothetical protein N44_01300 [Microcystis aeruginosa NIES-44]